MEATKTASYTPPDFTLWRETFLMGQRDGETGIVREAHLNHPNPELREAYRDGVNYGYARTGY